MAAGDLAQVTGGTCRLRPIQAEFGKECPPSEPCWDDEWDDCEVVTVTKITDNGTGAIVLDWHVGLGGPGYVLCAVASTYELNDTTCQTPTGTIDLGVCGCRPEYMAGPSAFLALQPSE